MLTKLMLLRCYNHFLSPPHHLSTTPAIFSLLRTTTTTPISSHSLSISYGPSLHKGALPSPTPALISDQYEDEQTSLPFDESQFVRVFEIAALRVPAQVCYELERRIRGHLLNWGRIPNIARVSGDEIDEEVRNLMGIEKEGGGDDDEDEVMKAVSRRIYGKAEGDGEELSGVLYRERLAKEFNARGFVRFRNLARVSRPNKKKKKTRPNEGEGREGEKGDGSMRRSVVVEVVEERENGGGDELSVLLGDDHKGKKWRGSTRLLLLDERYARRKPDELPEAVKAVLNEGSSEATKSNFELVRCNLKLFYDYWPMNEVLEALLPKDMVVPSAFETVGHIAHLNLRDEHLPYKKLIAKVVLDKNKPKIRTVVNKIEAISNDYRTMQLEVLSGNHSLVTTIIENGMRFQLDLATVYALQPFT